MVCPSDVFLGLQELELQPRFRRLSNTTRRKDVHRHNIERLGRGREMDVANFRRHSSCCCRTHGHILDVIVLKQGRRHESHRRGESRLRNHPVATGDFLQTNFPDRKAAMEDNHLARLPVTPTCSKQMPPQIEPQFARSFS